MPSAQRTLPVVADGPEPASERDLLLRASEQLQANLPEGWDIKVTTSSDPEVDARLEFERFGSSVLTYRVEIKRTVTRADALSLLGKQRYITERLTRQRIDEPEPWLLVTRYLSRQIQDLLRERGVSFIDATGNIFISADNPLVVISERGATADPWRGAGRPTTSLKGLPAALMVRALADYTPPLTVPELAKVAGASIGAAYRLVDYLTNEGLLSRVDRGPITEVDWPELLRRWSQDAPILNVNSTRGFLEPRGIDSLVQKLGRQASRQRYAVSGSLATQPYAPYADARLGLIYAEDPTALASDLGLRPVESGANVILAAPRSPVVFERTSSWRDITIVAPSQAAADLLGGPGRNPVEGEFLLDWMKENPNAWRRQLDR